MNKLRNKLDKIKEKPTVAFLDILVYRIAKNEVSISAASLTYFLILSIFPFFIALLNIVQFFDEGLLNQIMQTISLLPEDVAEIIQGFLKEIRSNSSVALLSVSLLASIYSSSSGVKQLVRKINKTYYFTEKRSFLSLIGISLIMTIALFFMILLIFIVQIIGSIFLNEIVSLLNIGNIGQSLVPIAINLIPFIFMFLTFYCLYRFSPDWPKGERVERKSLAISALFSTLGIILFTFIFKLYVANFASYSKTYGSLAGIIIFLVWLYLFGFIILIGGEIGATLYTLKTKGSKWPREETILSNFIGTTKTF